MEIFHRSKSQFINQRTGEFSGDIRTAATWLRIGDEVTLVYDHHRPLRLYDGGYLHSSQFDRFSKSYGMMVVDENAEYAICMPDEWTTKVPVEWNGRVACELRA